jgi:hypothetical protein
MGRTHFGESVEAYLGQFLWPTEIEKDGHVHASVVVHAAVPSIAVISVDSAVALAPNFRPTNLAPTRRGELSRRWRLLRVGPERDPVVALERDPVVARALAMDVKRALCVTLGGHRVGF